MWGGGGKSWKNAKRTNGSIFTQPQGGGNIFWERGPFSVKKAPFDENVFYPQWNPKYGCKGTVTTRFALIALVAWQY